MNQFFYNGGYSVLDFASSEEDVHFRIISCPESACPFPIEEDDLIDHLKSQHKIIQLPRPEFADTHKQPFRIRVLYRRRRQYTLLDVNAGPGGLPGFSSSAAVNSWIAGILIVDNEKFFLHVTEEAGYMFLYVTIFAQPDFKSHYVANIVLASPDGKLPDVSKLIQWRGTVQTYSGLGGEYGKLRVSSESLWMDYAFRTDNPAAVTALEMDQNETRLFWNVRVLIAKDPLLHAQLRIGGGSEVVTGKFFRDGWGDPDRRSRPTKFVVTPMSASLASIRYVQNLVKSKVPLPAIYANMEPLQGLRGYVSVETNGSPASTNSNELVPVQDEALEAEQLEVQNVNVSAEVSESELDLIEAAFFAGMLDEFLLPPEFYFDILRKVEAGKRLTNEESQAMDDFVEIYRLQNKYLQF